MHISRIEDFTSQMHKADEPYVLSGNIAGFGEYFSNSGVSHLARVTQNNPKIGVQNT
jgi:hypothetical protein